MLLLFTVSLTPTGIKLQEDRFLSMSIEHCLSHDRHSNKCLLNELINYEKEWRTDVPFFDRLSIESPTINLNWVKKLLWTYMLLNFDNPLIDDKLFLYN